MALFNSLRRLSFNNCSGPRSSGILQCASGAVSATSRQQVSSLSRSSLPQTVAAQTIFNASSSSRASNPLGSCSAGFYNSSSPMGAMAIGGIPTPSILTPALTISKRFYHEKVLDHFKDPRNVGQLDKKKKSVGQAIVGKASCGDVIKMSIEIDEADGTIKDAKFKTFGCGSAIASSSLATEMIIGKKVGEAQKITNTEIASHLNLPPVKVHCSVLAEEAINEAIKNYHEKNSE